LRPITALAASAAIASLPASTALAQRQPPTPEQRIERLERQVEEMQRRVFPKGRPADTAGFADDPAATQSSVMSLDQRLDALERQMSDLLRLSEENGNRLRSVENGLTQLRNDEDQRISTLEQRVNAAETAAPPAAEAAPVKEGPPPKKPSTQPKPAAAGGPAPQGETADVGAVPATDPGEDAYTEGFHLWQDQKYDEAIKSLRAFVAAYPKHRRVSWANNLIGRSLLDEGKPKAAAQVLFDNYRKNPGGERAPDSLYYLGQALTQLGQNDQACKVYEELDAVYGAKVRPDLKKLEAEGKTQANCS
jgi:TolA-binding protein